MGNLAWHVHHNVLVESCFDYEGRRQHIQLTKPPEEQEIRLRLFKMVQGVLPQAVLVAGAAYDQARAAYDQARAAYDQARAAYDQARAALYRARAALYRARAAYDQAGAALGQAGAAYDRARAAYDQARAAYDQAGAAFDRAVREHSMEIEALHAQECPDCPWDGQTIFPK